MEDKEKIEFLIKKVTKYQLIGIVGIAILFLVVMMFSVLMTVSNNSVNNKGVLYCELANKNADVANQMIPYFEMYMDDSIETVGKVNQTLAHLLELRLIGSRGLELPTLDCPIEKCDRPFAGPVDKAMCDLILELKYDTFRDLPE